MVGEHHTRKRPGCQMTKRKHDLATGEMTGRYKDSPMAFEAAANVNGVGGVDVYDLQRLYEYVSGIDSKW